MSRTLLAGGTVLVSMTLISCAGVVSRAPLRLSAAHGRFAVELTRQVVREAANHDVALATLAERDLSRIDSLLPGPPTSVLVTVGDPEQIVASTGTSGFTDPESGAVTVGLYGTWTEEPPNIETWLARTLAREISKSVRVRTGPGFGSTLIDQLVSEGIATAFDQSAFPGPPDPWTDALTARQECHQWRVLKPVLSRTGLYNAVMAGGPVPRSVFGESTMPQLTGLAVGYRMVADYLARHPRLSWTALATTPARTIYAGSGYAPCAGT